jgi:hypothetical protein
MTPSSTPLRLIVISQRDQEGWTTATIAAVLGTISMGPNRREARDNGFDALREMLAAPVNVPGRRRDRGRRLHARAGT